MILCYLLRRGAESLVIYLVDRDPGDMPSTWTHAGWEIVEVRELPRPFPGVKRTVVYA